MLAVEAIKSAELLENLHLALYTSLSLSLITLSDHSRCTLMMVPRESGLHFKPGFSHTAERFICVPFHSLLSLLVCSQPRQEARPNSARCIHFIRSNALRISILIPRTSCCRPQAAYGAEYAVMNNKPQSKPKSVILQPFFFKFDGGSSPLDFCTSLIWSDETRGGTSDAIIQLKEKIWSAVKTVSLN